MINVRNFIRRKETKNVDDSTKIKKQNDMFYCGMKLNCQLAKKKLYVYIVSCDVTNS